LRGLFYFEEVSAMTVSFNTPRADYTGNGSVSVYPVPFTLFVPTDLVVHVDGVLQELGIHYVVDGVLPGATSDCVFLPGHIPENGTHVILEGAAPITQPVDLGAGQRFYEDTVEGMVDRNTVLIKQLNQRVIKLALGMQIPPDGGSGSGGGLEFPPPKPDGYIKWDAEGKKLVTIEEAPQGPEGPKGDQGLQGDKGDTGISGPEGSKGDKGDTGNTGPQGIPGEQGSQGVKGDKGDKGDTGNTGPQGIPGEAAVANINYKGIWAPGTYVKNDCAISLIDGNSYVCTVASTTEQPGPSAVNWALWVQKGPQGQQGAQGPVGATGDKGDAGSAGLQGIQGVQGVKGDKGDTGATGPPGQKGDKGDKGDTGSGGGECPLAGPPVNATPGVNWNGGFENNLTNWSSTPTGGATAAIDTTDPAVGSKCLMIDANASTKSLVAGNSIHVPVTPSIALPISYRMKSNSAATGKNEVILDWLKANQSPSSVLPQTKYEYVPVGGSGIGLTGGTMLQQGSFEGAASPFKIEYSGADIYTDSTAPDGTRSLRFTYPSGYGPGNAPDNVFVGLAATNELLTEYYFKYSANYFRHYIVNKLTYWWIGATSNFYVGVSGPSGVSGNNKITVALQHNNTGQTDDLVPNTGNDVLIANGQWYKLTLYSKLNTGGGANGILKVWIDELAGAGDVLVMDYSNAPFLVGSDSSKQFNEFAFGPIFGGAGGGNKPAIDYMYFDKVSIKAGPFTSSGGGTPTGDPIPTVWTKYDKSPVPPSDAAFVKASLRTENNITRYDDIIIPGADVPAQQAADGPPGQVIYARPSEISLEKTWPTETIADKIAAAGCAEQNQILNGSFEVVDGTGLPAGWSISEKSANTSVSVITTDFAHGQKSVRIIADTAATLTCVAIITSFLNRCFNGSPVKLSYRLKCTKTSSGCHNIYVLWYDAGLVALPYSYVTHAFGVPGYVDPLPLPSVWTKYEHTFMPPPGAEYFRIALRGSVTGPNGVLFDDLTAYASSNLTQLLGTDLPSGQVINLSAPASGGTVTAPSDGYIYIQSNPATAISQYISITCNGVAVTMLATGSNVTLGGFLPVIIGGVVTINFTVPSIAQLKLIKSIGGK
jgi:hypothetical protein